MPTYIYGITAGLALGLLALEPIGATFLLALAYAGYRETV